MKIKGLLIGMLACTAMLVGCTDDDIIQNGNEMQDEVAKMDTYVTISIDASTSSSRTTNDGDEHGNAEHSGHTNAGSVQENAVKEVLVVLTRVNEDGTSVEYDAAIKNGIAEVLSVDNFTQNTGTKVWKKNTPYRMDETGTYKALIVINPVKGLKEAIAELGGNHVEAYNKICEYSGESITTNPDGTKSFMMANREALSIKVDESHNSPDNAAGATNADVISVERAASKITFRWKPADETLGIGANVYPVTVNTKAYLATAESYWYMKKDSENKDRYYYAKFNVASVGDKTYYVLLKTGTPVVGGQLDVNDVIGVFEKQFDDQGNLITHDGTPDGNTYTGEIALLKDVTEDVTTKASKTLAQFIETLTFTQTETTNPDDKTYYIKLEQYALTNLSKTVYAVRHVSGGTAEAYSGAVAQMALLGDDYSYLIDPNSKDKSSTGYDATKASTWFNQPLTEVEAAANVLGTSNPTTTTYFNTLPGSYSTNDPDTKVNVDKDGIEPEYDETGAYLTYCHENAVLASKQVKGLVTGIVFVGKIYSDKECTAEQTVQKMYKYDNIYYETLRALLNANPGVNAFANLTENSSDAAAKDAGIVVYNGGTCFYYSSQIEHYDNDGYETTEAGVQELKENGPGIMENAIMRNNIYSLSVKTLGEIGSATLELEGDESTADMGAYITMQAKILPWIVRFNNIQF